MVGLVSAIQLLVGIQQPIDLNAAYALALLSEELGDTATVSPILSSFRASNASETVNRQSGTLKVTENKQSTDSTHQVSTPEDRGAALRAYRKSKGLCFICGERWAREHKCKQEIQLHVVQEMWDYMLTSADSNSETEDTFEPEINCISVSAVAMADVSAPTSSTMKLKIQLQGLSLVVLVDSGSTHSFVAEDVALKLQGTSMIPVNMVKVANGQVIACDKQLCDGHWSCDGHEFTTTFRVLPLGSYDGILGLDWLASHSPMQID